MRQHGQLKEPAGSAWPMVSGIYPRRRPPFLLEFVIDIRITALLVAFYQRLFRSPCFIFPEEVLDYRPLRIFAPQEFIMLVQAR